MRLPIPFENCSVLTPEHLTAVALTRAITAIICCVILLIVLAVLMILARWYFQRVCGTTVKRLAIGLLVTTVLYQINLVLHLKHYYLSSGSEYCVVFGFFDQYIGCVRLLFTLGTSMVLFFKVLKVSTSWSLLSEYYNKANRSTFTCCGRNVNKLEVILFVSLFILPLLFDWIPFTTNSYGSFGTWCWIRVFEVDCSTHIAGLWELIWLWNVPYGIVAIQTFGLIIGSLCLLHCHSGVKSASIQKRITTVGIVDFFSFLVFLGLTLLLCVLEVAVIATSLKYEYFGLLLSYAVAAPLSGALIPLALLVTIHFPMTSICKHRSLFSTDGQEQATEHESSDWSLINLPSHTTWTSPHSSYVPYADDDEQ